MLYCVFLFLVTCRPVARAIHCVAGVVCPVAEVMYTVLGKVRSSAGVIDSVAGVVCPVAGVILISVRGLAHSIKRTETRQVIMFSTKPLEMWG